MFKFYKIVTNKLLFFGSLATIVLGIISALVMFISDAGKWALSFAGSYAYFMIPLYLQSAFTPVGPSPSVKKSIETSTAMRESIGGAASNYDMICVLPVKRSDYVKYPAVIWLILSAITAAAMIVSSLSDGELIPQISTVYTVQTALISISSPMGLMQSNRRMQIPAAVMMIIAAVIFLVTTFMNLADLTYLVPVLPTAVRIAIAVFMLLFNIVFMVRTVWHGEFARNSERVYR